MASNASMSADTIMNNMLNVVKSTLQQCVSPVDRTQVANITGTPSQVINLGNINWTQAVKINSDCLQGSVSVSNLTSSLRQNGQVLARNIFAKTGISAQSPVGLSISQAINNLGTAIVNAYQSNCGRLGNSVTFMSASGGSLGSGSINWTQDMNSIIQCISSDANVSVAKTNLLQALRHISPQQVTGQSQATGKTAGLAETDPAGNVGSGSSSNLILWILIIVIVLLFIWALYVNKPHV